VTKSKAKKSKAKDEKPAAETKEESGEKVVSLDSFRKK